MAVDPTTKDFVLASGRTINIEFPIGSFDTTFSPAPSDAVQLIPGDQTKKKHLALMSVHFRNGKSATVTGYGWEYHNPDDPGMEAWVNEDDPISGGVSLLDVLMQSEFHIVAMGSVNEVEREWRSSLLPLFIDNENNYERESHAVADDLAH